MTTTLAALADTLTTARPRDWWPLIARAASDILRLYYPHRRRCRP